MPYIRNFLDIHRILQSEVGLTHIERPYRLDRMRALLAFLGNPQDSLRIIHVAGTSGKTSTAYYVAALLEQAGYLVGLTVSPHIDEINERLQLGTQPLTELEFCRAFERFYTVVRRSKVQPSYFELLVAFAFYEFSNRGVDYAVVEVGIGGLLDTTNTITREDKVCVITDIGYDHMALLGSTLAEIAAQKAGIIQQHNYAFMYKQVSDVMNAVYARCELVEASLHIVEQRAFLSSMVHSLPLFQRRNFNIAFEVFQFIRSRDHIAKLSDAQVALAASTYIPGRMEVHQKNGKTIILDGAHNAHKLAALLSSVKAAYPYDSIACMTVTKPGERRWKSMVQELIASEAYLIISGGGSAAETERLSLIADYIHDNRYTKFEIEPDLRSATQKLRKRPESVLIATGSFYFLHEERTILLS